METATAMLIIIVTLTGSGKAASVDHMPMANMEACAVAEVAVEAARTEGGTIDAICVNNALPPRQ